MDLSELGSKKCTPCNKNTPPLQKTQLQYYLNLLPSWAMQDNKLEREIRTKSFSQSLALANIIAGIAEEENHHPDLFISWGFLKITIFTHAINGLSENDFILAAKLDRALSL